MSGGVTVFTVGHSNHTYREFLELILSANVQAIADVRSSPFSRYNPHFNGSTLKSSLRTDRILYTFLGKELGGRPSDPRLYDDGVADYERMAMTSEFRIGLDRIRKGAEQYRVALLCSEQDPLDCHRCLLVGRSLAGTEISVRHILPSKATLSQEEIERQLLYAHSGSNDDMFVPLEQRLAAAYRVRAKKVAFAERMPEASA